MSGERVIVVGAGPVGLVAARLLAGYGVATLVLDRRPRPYPLPRAVHLDDAAVRVLQRIGLADAFAAISRPGAGLRLLDADLRPFAVFERPVLGAAGHPGANLFDQPDLERLLRTELPAEVELVEGVEVVAVRAGGRSVDVRDADRTLRTIVAAAVLGCDGAGSTVRAGIGARWLRVAGGRSQRWLVIDAEVAAGGGPIGWGGVDQVCDPARAATFLHVTGSRYRWEFRLRAGESAAALSTPDALERLLAPWSVGSTVRIRVRRAAEYTVAATVADRWRSGRVLLAGDAAHLTPPFVGQGLGAGLRDVENLAWKLAAVLAGDADDGLLESYAAERVPHVRATIATAVRVGAAMTGGGGWAARLRRPVVAGLLRIPGAQARAEASTTVRMPPGPVVARRRHRRDLAGSVCPQPLVRLSGTPTSMPFDDVAGPGWVLLTAGGPLEPVLRDRADAHRARPLRLRPTDLGLDTGSDRDGDVDADTPVIHDDGTLARWLTSGRATAVLLRPDGVVADTQHAHPRRLPPSAPPAAGADGESGRR